MRFMVEINLRFYCPVYTIIVLNEWRMSFQLCFPVSHSIFRKHHQEATVIPKSYNYSTNNKIFIDFTSQKK
jgi:hypothetical protein